MKEAVPPGKPRSGAGSSHPEFLRGFEVGRIQSRIELLGHVTLREVIRRGNEVAVGRLAMAAGRAYQAEIIDDEWMAVVIDPVHTAERPSRSSRLEPKIVRFGADEPIVSMRNAPTYRRATFKDRGRDGRKNEMVVAVSRLTGWSLGLHAMRAVFRATEIPLPQHRHPRNSRAATALLEPEPDLGESPEAERPDWPTFNMAGLEPDADEGGQTSYYSGEVTGITQVVQLMHNIASGKNADEGLHHVREDERVFDLDS